jgi:oligopeptide transport system permease protein
MLKYITLRLLQYPLLLAIIYLITFFLAWVIPGNPFERSERKLPEAARERLTREFHADNQWAFLSYYPWRILHGDFGPSFEYDEWTVNDVLRTALPVSITLGTAALVLAAFVGVGVGTMAAVHRGGLFDWSSLAGTLFGLSLPSFVAAAVLLEVFSVHLRMFPVGGWGHYSDLFLPSIALSLIPMAYISRLTRVAMLDVLSADYVRTARAKGLSRALVIWKHCLRNAVLPVVSYLGPAAADTLTGSCVIEKVFNIPGLGSHFVNSVLNKDQPMILGTVMVYSFLLLSFNLLVDLAYGWVDPRIDVTQ